MRVVLGTYEITDTQAELLHRRLTGSGAKRRASRDQARTFLLGACAKALEGLGEAVGPAPAPTAVEPVRGVPEGALARLQRAVRVALQCIQQGESDLSMDGALRALLPVAGLCGLDPTDLPSPSAKAGTDEEGPDHA